MDLDRIKRNVAKMTEMGAPMEDIDGYIASEGATIDQIKAHKVSQGWGEWAASLPGRAVDAVRGTQDPAYAETPFLDISKAFTLDEQAEADPISAQNYAKVVTFDDAAYGDVLRKNLGDRFVRTEKDANGYDVIVYRDANGNEAKGYVNKPGLDWQDVDRFVSNAAPFLAAGGIVGSSMRGAGTLARMGGQAATGAATSLGLDAAAQQAGSEQGADLTRAGLVGAAGAAGELVAPVVSALTRTGRAYVDDAGKLTPRGEKAARKLGMDPAQMSPDVSRQFGQWLSVGTDQAEAAIAARTGEFGLKSTKATRTKDPGLSAIEKDIRAGNLGPQAARILKDFDEEAKRRLEAAAFDGTNGHVGIGSTLAPMRGGAERHPAVLGGAIREGVDAAKGTMRAAERRAWENVTDLRPTADGLQMLPDIITRRVGQVPIDPKITPVATQMAKELDAFMSGTAFQEPVANVIKQTNIETVDMMRRRLLASYKAAPPNTADAKAAKAIYDGFDEWMETTAEQGLLNGDPTAYAAMRIARDKTKEVRGLIEPRSPSGKLSPAGRILKDISDNADTPERIITTIFGGAGPQTPPKAGAVEALSNMRNILLRSPREGAKETWQDIKLAYWTRLVTGKNGEILTPHMMRENINKALRNQKSVFDVLYAPKERDLMRRFAAALEDTIFKDPNPSGTASALRSMMRNNDSLAKTALQTQSKRELFSKHNVMLSRIYSMLAQKLPIDPLGLKQSAATSAARRAISQDVTRRPPAILGNKTAPIGLLYADDENVGP